MSPFPEKIFYIRNKGFYLDIETTKNPLNQYQVICSKEQNKSTQLWFYDNKQQSIKNYQTKGFLTKKYYGWTPSKTNLLLQTEHDYDIEIKPLSWKRISQYLSVDLDQHQYVLCRDIKNNIILQKKGKSNLLFDDEWEIIVSI